MFESSSLVQVVIPDMVISKNKGHFQNCSLLQQVIITEQYKDIVEIVSTIPDNAFDWCSSLRQISLPETISVIGEYAFRSCQSLQNVEISAVRIIKKGAFIARTSKKTLHSEYFSSISY